MDHRRELRRFPGEERCPDCGARKWYLENGLRFCSSGHQVQGFVQFDVGDEADSGKMGSVARKEKEVKEKELRHLTGQAGKNLFLECLQLVLRSQLLWLIRKRGHRDELETVVRDLWDLRTRGSSNAEPEDGQTDGALLEMFSSQPEDAAPKPSEGQRSRAQSWDPERGPDWPMPQIMDTLVLCYLGCLLLRTPTTVGEICRWANAGWMPYKRAYYDLPQEMRDRLPSAYTNALKLPLRRSVDGTALHDAVMKMALSYQRNYNLQFPAVNAIPTLASFAKQLALPVDVIVMARSVTSVMNLSFRLPLHKSRVFIADYPEVLLLSILIISAKVLFPSNGHQPPILGHDDGGEGIRIGWEKWGMEMTKPDDEAEISQPDLAYETMTAGRVTSMEAGELDKYFGYLASQVDKRNDSAIVNFFPTEEATPLRDPPAEATEAQLGSRFAQVLHDAVEATQGGLESAADETAYAAQPHEAFRSVEDLSKSASPLYEVAGRLAGLTLADTVRAVYMVEQKILVWQAAQQVKPAEHLQEE